MAPRHHVVISGTGRAGTTFLVQLLTELKLDTGFSDTHSQIYAYSQAGMELDLRDVNAPYIVKSPWLCDYLDELLVSGNVVIDHAIVPVRDLYSAAQSRRDVVDRVDLNQFGGRLDNVPGGLWHTTDPEKQEAVLAGQLHKLLHVLAHYEIPLTLLIFPRLVTDPEYLYRSIRLILGDIGYDAFLSAFKAVSRPELVHVYVGTSKGE